MKLESVYHKLKAPKQSTSVDKPDGHNRTFTRKIKQFSGREAIGPGECGVGEWLILAQDVVDYDTKLSPQEKLDYLRNTLVGDALQLLSSCLDDIQDGQQLVELISRTYGGQISPEQLEFEFRQTTQKDRERPSVYWARLQQNLVKWAKSSKDDINMDSLRLGQFVWGLCPTDSDLLGVRLGLTDMIAKQCYPPYSKMLEDLQNIERERRERHVRAGSSKIRSGLVAVEDSSKDVDDLRAKVAQLSVQVPQQLDSSTELGAVAANVVSTPQSLSEGQNRQRQRKRGQKSRKPCWNCGSLQHQLARCLETFDADRVRENFQKFRESKAKKPLN